MSVSKINPFSRFSWPVKVLLVLLLFLLVSASFFLSVFKGPLHLDQNLTYTLAPHETMTVLIDDLSMRHIIQYPKAARLLSEQFSGSRQLRAGEYLIKPTMNLREFIALLSSGRVRYYPITIVDGWTFATLMQHLAENPYLLHDLSYRNNLDFMAQLSGKHQSPEGKFLPQTYFVTLGSSEYNLLDRAYQAMQQHLKQAWESRAPGLRLRNPEQALVLASLVEEESKQRREMPLIASVFYNRLSRGMPLQSDPTVLYAVNKPYGSHISHRDLRSRNPFNTYTHEGLPPAPIGLPGQAALWAVLHPERSSYYYFEADGHGEVVFSKNLQGQEAAISRYNKGH